MHCHLDSRTACVTVPLPLRVVVRVPKALAIARLMVAAANDELPRAGRLHAYEGCTHVNAPSTKRLTAL
jgi:hypothetical protein